MNTEFTYLYRDASNYKKLNKVILKGSLSKSQIKKIIATLDYKEFFIPEQVDLPVERFSSITEDDHPWCELSENDIKSTEKAPTIIDKTANELYEKFMEVNGKWDDIRYAV